MKIAVIGSGNMGSLFIRSFAKEHSVTVCDRGSGGRGKALALELGALYTNDIKKSVEGSDLILLAVKPKDFSEIALSLKGTLAHQPYIVSLLSNVTTAILRQAFPEACVFRLMPNTACLVRKGILGFCEDGVSLEQKKLMTSVFSSLGHLIWIPEKKMAAFATLAASSPAFIFVLTESMIDAGVQMGFSMKEAKEIVAGVLEGCSALLHTGLSPQELKWQITSPQGTTVQGLKALEDSSFRRGIWSALEATYQKSKE